MTSQQKKQIKCPICGELTDIETIENLNMCLACDHIAVDVDD